MSSIRLFILGSLAERGAMHGHALKLLAEEEHVDEWADVTPGAIYGAIKRLAAEGLIDAVRVEREGNYPERQVFEVTASGIAALEAIRLDALETIVYRTDPFDLGMARLGAENLDDLRGILERRLADFRAKLRRENEHVEQISHYLTLTERQVMRHDAHRIRAEIAYHEELLAALPEIIADETARKDSRND